MKIILIAEIGINANGDVATAKKLIDLAKQGGCQYVKFQKRTIEDVYTKEELDKFRDSPWGTTNREQKNGLEFTLEQYKEIDRYCKEIGIGWFASPWDIKSVDFLVNNFNLPFIKIASASITDSKLLQRIKETNIPVILSTGMSSEAEVDAAVRFLGNQIKYILHCKATYPTKTEDMNMLAIKTLQTKYWPKYSIGFSNHSSGISFIMMAYCLGASMIEYHITLDRTMYGSDQAASIEPAGVMKIKDWLESFDTCWGNGKIECLPNEIPVKTKLRKV
jgi:N-acetylneuraminate synthase